MAGFATGFFQQADVFDMHASINRFQHVVDGEQADRGGGQRFHFNSRPSVALGSDLAMDRRASFVKLEFGSNPGQGNRVAQRNQFRGAFAGLDGGDAGNAQDIAFPGMAGADQGKGFGQHENTAGGPGDPGGFSLGADVHHVGLAGGIKVGKGIGGHGVTFSYDLVNRPDLTVRYHSTMRIVHRLVVRLTALSLAFVVAVEPVLAENLPELGDVASNELSLATEKKIGQQIMHEIRRMDPSYLDDPDVEAYLNQIGSRLASASSDPGIGFYFFPVSENSINAFAMPGGFIGVNTGLLLAAQSESELAGVLAHEVSHVTQRHIARQVFKEKKLSIATMVATGLALLAARSSSQVASAAVVSAEAAAVSAQLAFTRDFEREADRAGFDTLTKAGYDVRGMSNFFERLQRAGRVYENNAPVYLRTHPLTGERISDMQNREHAVSYKQVQDSTDFQLVRARLRAMQGTPGEAVKLAREALQDKKFVTEASAHYGYAVALSRNRDWAGAEREVAAARKFRAVSPMLDRLQAEARLGQGDVTGGLALYRDAMIRYPLNQALRYGYGDALLANRRFDESLRFAEALLLNYSQDVRLHKMRAESYAAQGRQALKHRAYAEVYAIQGQTPAAVEQLELAQKSGDANFYELSTIDSRLREMKKQLADEMKEKGIWR